MILSEKNKTEIIECCKRLNEFDLERYYIVYYSENQLTKEVFLTLMIDIPEHLFYPITIVKTIQEINQKSSVKIKEIKINNVNIDDLNILFEYMALAMIDDLNIVIYGEKNKIPKIYPFMTGLTMDLTSDSKLDKYTFLPILQSNITNCSIVKSKLIVFSFKYNPEGYVIYEHLCGNLSIYINISSLSGFTSTGYTSDTFLY